MPTTKPFVKIVDRKDPRTAGTDQIGKNKVIAGAGLDVYENEPINPDNKLLYMDNVIATPHCAWYSEESILTLQRKVAEEVVNILQGNLPFNIVNKEVLENK